MNELPIHREDWKSTGMIRAENALFDLADRAERQMSEVDKRMAELEQRERPVTDEDVAALNRFARDPRAPVEWRDVAGDVEAGLFTWRDVAEGKVDTNPAVAAAMDATANMRLEPPEEVATEEPPPPVQTRRAPRADWRDRVPRADFDEEDFSRNTLLEPP